jgi:hypothetical protein
MVDYCIIDPEIVEALRKINTLDVKTTLECGYNPWTEDETLVAGTTEKGRLLITSNYRDITPRKYPPCGHGGILLIKHPKPTGQIVYDRMRAFTLSGGRSHAKGHVTYLNADKAEILKLHKEVIELRF